MGVDADVGSSQLAMTHVGFALGVAEAMADPWTRFCELVDGGLEVANAVAFDEVAMGAAKALTSATKAAKSAVELLCVTCVYGLFIWVVFGAFINLAFLSRLTPSLAKWHQTPLSTPITS